MDNCLDLSWFLGDKITFHYLYFFRFDIALFLVQIFAGFRWRCIAYADIKRPLVNFVDGVPAKLYRAAGIAIGVLGFFFAPLSLYLSGNSGFGARADWDVLTSLLAAFVCWCLVLYLLWFWCPDFLKIWLSWLIFIICMVFLLHGTLFLTDFGVIDGLRFATALVFSRLPLWKDSFIYAIILIMTFICSFYRLGKQLRTVLWLVTISLLLACGQILFLPPPEETEFENGHVVSQSRPNYLLFMLDAFTAEHLRDILAMDQELRSDLAGFTWYEDTVADGGCTLFTLPAMLGGMEYNAEGLNNHPERSRVDKVSEAFARLPNLILDKGGRVAMSDPGAWIFLPDSRRSIMQKIIHPQSVKINNPASFPDQLLKQFMDKTNPGYVEQRDPMVLTSFLLSASLFRLAPVGMKSQIYNDHNWLHSRETLAKLQHYRASQRIAMLANLDKAFAVDQGAATFNLILSGMTHAPYYLGSGDLTLHPSEQPPQPTEKHALRMLADFFAWMRNNNVYDNTFIVIASDHNSRLKNMPLRVNDNHLIRIWSVFRPNSLLLVKQIGATRPLTIDSRQMQTSDVHSLLAAAIEAGSTAFDLATPLQRTRMTYQGSWRWDEHPSNELSIMYRAKLEGGQFDSEKWQLIKAKGMDAPW